MFALTQSNPFTPNYSITTDKNYLILKNPIDRHRAGISQLDDNFFISSKYFQSAKHQKNVK